MDMKVLVVEDEEQIADFLVRGLREEGFIVDHAADGDRGWAALKSQSWDVVVLDWWLPGTDGMTLLRRFRQAGHLTPVLFLTARDAVSDRVRGLDNGADDYLCKPFVFAELLARVRAMSRRGNAQAGNLLSYDDVTIDLATHHARRAGKRLQLTAKEEALLAFLLRHPETPLSRTSIYQRVWDDQYDGLSNTLEVHIMSLRRQLEKHGPRLIHTLRGRGYLLSSSAHPPEES